MSEDKVSEQASPRMIYALVSGEYSDYGVHAVFSTYEAAVNEMTRLNAIPRIDRRSPNMRDDMEVQLFMLDPTPEQLLAMGGVEVHIDEGGEIVEPDHWRKRHPTNPFAPPYEYGQYVPNGPAVRVFVGYGVDAERARRAAEEFRALVLLHEREGDIT